MGARKDARSNGTGGVEVVASASAARSVGIVADGDAPLLQGNSIAERSTSPAQHAQTEAAAHSWHSVMWLPLVIVIPAALVCTRYFMEAVAERRAHMEAHPEKFGSWSYPALHEMTVTLYSLLILLFLRITLCKYVFVPLGRWFLPTVAEKKGKWTPSAREDRVQRFSSCMFKLCYFIFITIYGYYELIDASWLPPAMGGTGSVEDVWNDWPYSEVTARVKQYYLIALSYHAHSLVMHLCTVRRNDFVEMTLHHLCAVLLVVFSYFANYIRLGSLVLLLHDIADVWAYAVKAVVDSRHTKVTLAAYVGLLISWGYTRLYVFPMYVIRVASIPGEGHGIIWMTTFFMILLLQCLHIYWYILFLIMGYRFMISGKTVDIQQKAGAEDGSYHDYHKRRESDADAHQHDDQQLQHASSTTNGNTRRKAANGRKK